MEPLPIALLRRAPTLLGRPGLLCVFATSLSLCAQELPVRRVFLNELLSESQLLTEQYERALSKLESELAAAADYEDARLVQHRRDELKAIYMQIGKSNTLAIPLPSDKARLSGTAEARGDLLTGWRTAGSSAEWSNLRVTPGSYFLELDASLTELPGISGSSLSSRSQPQEKVSFGFYEVSLLQGAQENRRTFDIALSKDEATFTPLRIGPVTFTRSPVTLRLLPAAGYPANLVRLRQMRLALAQDDVITAAPMADNGESLNQAKQRLMDDLERVQKTVLSAYDTKLKTLAKISAEMGTEAAAEIKKLEMMRKADASGAHEKPLFRMLTKSGGVAGFEDIEGVKIIATGTTQGDRLTIEHDGKQMAIRLLWVECAPLTEAGDSGKGFAKHFGISTDNTAALARAAREFTMGYLEGKPLRLLIRPGKDKDGSQAALVFLPEVGLFQNVLVDQGLAAVHPPIKDVPRGMIEKSLLSNLLEREAAAKRQKNGAWALGSEDQ